MKADNENSSERQADINSVQSHQVADEDEDATLFPEDRNEPNNDSMWERNNWKDAESMTIRSVSDEGNSANEPLNMNKPTDIKMYYVQCKVVLVVKNLPANAGDIRDVDSSLGWGDLEEGMIHPGVGNGNPLQYSCLENPKDRGAWWATVHGVTKSQTRPK